MITVPADCAGLARTKGNLFRLRQGVIRPNLYDKLKQTNMEEKIYHFTESRGVDKERQIFVKESELTESQKNLLLVEAIHRYKDLMPELKERFLAYILKCDCGRDVGIGKCNICDNDD